MMRMTLEMFEKVDLLLKEDRLSQREIARRVGVSRSTVNNIANGSD